MRTNKLLSPIVVMVFLFMIFSPIVNLTPALAAIQYTITVTYGPNGQISPGTTVVDKDASQGFTITPSNGYSIASLIVDGSPITVASSYTFSNVKFNHSISATFTTTPSPTPTATPTLTPTPTSTASPTPTPTSTPDPTSEPTFSPTPTPSSSIGPNPTSTQIPISSPAPTLAPTVRPTSTASHEPTQTPELVPLHDIAISQITPSGNQVQVAQMFSFEVTVKNRGTFSETFNVILYCNDTTIGDQRITAMTPTSEKTLSFQWDTSGFAKENVYSIKAITSEIKNDSDTENNIYTLNYVKQEENSTIPIGLGIFWGTPWIYLALGLAGFTATCLLVIKKRKPKHPGNKLNNSNPKIFQGINDITDGAFPDAYSIMVVGEADSEKSVFCQQLANGYLKQGKPVLYITYDQFPEEVRTNMKELGWDIISHEEKGNFAFLDAYSSTGGKESKEKYSVKQPFALSELGIGMSMVLSAFDRNSVKIFLDSTSPLFTRVDPSKVVEFLQDRIAKVKGENATIFFTVGKGTIQENFQRRLEEMVDCVIELEVQKEKKKVVRKVHFKKIRGQKQPNFDIFIDTTDELTHSILKTPSKR